MLGNEGFDLGFGGLADFIVQEVGPTQQRTGNAQRLAGPPPEVT